MYEKVHLNQHFFSFKITVAFYIKKKVFSNPNNNAHSKFHEQKLFFLHPCLGLFNDLYAHVVINVLFSKKPTAYCMLLKVSLYARCYFQRSQLLLKNLV